MCEPLISIIIPVYKAEKYLSRCVDSVLLQTYANLEIILVDDGSPDACPQICDAYVQEDSRIKVLHKSNGGASSARNAGLDIATGEYVCFVDSDDRVPVDGFEQLYKAISETGSQYAAGVCQINDRKVYKNAIKQQEIIDFSEKPMELLEYLTKSGSYSPYAKIYRMDIIQNNSIRFDPSLKCSEDALMIRQYMKYCGRICLTPHVVYSYNTGNENSLSKKGYPDYCLYFAEKMKALDELTSLLPITEHQRNVFLTERAFHGLKISSNHYLSNWSEDNEQQKLVQLSIEVLSPWMALAKLDSKSDAYSFWNKYQKSVQKGDLDSFILTIKRERGMKAFSLRIRNFVGKHLKK